MNLIRRKTADVDTAEVTLDDRPTKVGGKNAPTPRRTVARAARAQQVKGAPSTRKERRAQSNSDYRTAQAAMKQTDVAKLPARERVPELIYVRDLVDSRLNLASAMIPVIAVYFVGTFVVAKNHQLQLDLVLLTFFWLIGMVVDAVILARKVDTRVQTRFPGSTVKVAGYAARRAFAPKRIRRPIVRPVPPANHWKTPA